MSGRAIALATAFSSLLICSASGQSAFERLGFDPNTIIIADENDGDFCAGADLLQNDDGGLECAYAWRFQGVQAPDYGAWAECYDSDFVCGIQFFFTQLGYYEGETMDVYVWEDDGVPPPDNNPGNILCAVMNVDPGPPSMWPFFTTHEVHVCCLAGGAHFVGFWGNWPGEDAAWFVGTDCNPGEGGCPRTKIAPGIGYPTGWADTHDIPPFNNIKDLGIREYAGIGDCPPTPAQGKTWGRIKALY